MTTEPTVIGVSSAMRPTKVNPRRGLAPKARHPCCAVEADKPQAFAMPRELQWMGAWRRTRQRPHNY